MDPKVQMIRRINKSIVHEDGTIDSFEKQLSNLKAGTFDVSTPLVISPDSSCLEYFLSNTANKPLTIRVSTVFKIRNKHKVDFVFIAQCLDFLRGSVLAFESLQKSTSKVIVMDVCNKDGDPYIAICRLDRRMNMIDVNEITSIYDKQNFEQFLTRTFDADKIFYKNRKIEQYIKSHRLQLPKEMIYALSDNYSKLEFSKSQVMAHLKSHSTSLHTPKASLETQIRLADSKSASHKKYRPNQSKTERER